MKNFGFGCFMVLGDEILQLGDDFVFGVVGLGEGEGEILGVMSYVMDCCQFYWYFGVLEFVLLCD